jgi:hypothetical protein
MPPEPVFGSALHSEFNFFLSICQKFVFLLLLGIYGYGAHKVFHCAPIVFLSTSPFTRQILVFIMLYSVLNLLARSLFIPYTAFVPA